MRPVSPLRRYRPLGRQDADLWADPLVYRDAHRPLVAVPGRPVQGDGAGAVGHEASSAAAAPSAAATADEDRRDSRGGGWSRGGPCRVGYNCGGQPAGRFIEPSLFLAYREERAQEVRVDRIVLYGVVAARHRVAERRHAVDRQPRGGIIPVAAHGHLGRGVGAVHAVHLGRRRLVREHNARGLAQFNVRARDADLDYCADPLARAGNPERRERIHGRGPPLVSGLGDADRPDVRHAGAAAGSVRARLERDTGVARCDREAPVEEHACSKPYLCGVGAVDQRVVAAGRYHHGGCAVGRYHHRGGAVGQRVVAAGRYHYGGGAVGRYYHRGWRGRIGAVGHYHRGWRGRIGAVAASARPHRRSLGDGNVAGRAERAGRSPRRKRRVGDVAVHVLDGRLAAGQAQLAQVFQADGVVARQDGVRKRERAV